MTRHLSQIVNFHLLFVLPFFIDDIVLRKRTIGTRIFFLKNIYIWNYKHPPKRHTLNKYEFVGSQLIKMANFDKSLIIKVFLESNRNLVRYIADIFLYFYNMWFTYLYGVSWVSWLLNYATCCFKFVHAHLTNIA